MLRISRLVLALFSITLLPALLQSRSWAQAAPTTAKVAKDDPSYREAVDLYKQGKFVSAMPLFEKMSAEYPSDYGVRESWAWCMFEYAATLPDPEQRKKVRARARSVALQAKNLGDDSQMLQLMLEQPEAGGAEAKFSDRKDVDDAMKAAEADFARGEMDKARDGYLRVLLIDPNNYEAALFIGDVYFKQHAYGNAGEWFARAIQINPDRESAYRYWGDALVAMGKEDDARARFIDGIIADPYSRRSWTGLTNWLQRNKVQLNNIRLQDRCTITVKDEKNINITLDGSLPKDDPNGVAWLAYGMGRAAWHTEKSEKEFPNVPRNRRTLQEEAHALDLMVTVLKQQNDYAKKVEKLDPSLQALIKIKEAGFLEPFVLLNRVDAEIAQDYEAYRATNRDTIRRYLDEFMVPKTPPSEPK